VPEAPEGSTNRGTGPLKSQFVIVIQEHDISNISRKERRFVARNEGIVGNNRRIQKIIVILK
jgi:hypothetical protein